MKLTSYSRASLLVVSTLFAVWAPACSDDDPDPAGAGGSDAGGTTSVGGKAGVGGTTAKGGTTAVGGTATGGAAVAGAATGGAATGGTANAGAGGAATGGAATGGTVNAGASGMAQAGAAGAGATCGTTPSTITTQTTTFNTDLSGFAINTASSSNTGKALTQLTDATIGGGMCANGCARLTGVFAAGDAAWSNGVIIQKSFTAATNLVGAKIVAKIAIDNPNNTPIQFKLFAQTGDPNWAWAEKGITTEVPNYALAGGAKDFEYVVVDVPGAGTAKPFCAASVAQYGFQIQTSGTAVSATTAGTVNVYIQQVSIIGPGGGNGGTAGAAGAAGASNAGTAGTTAAAGASAVAGSAGVVAAAGNAGTAGSP